MLSHITYPFMDADISDQAWIGSVHRVVRRLAMPSMKVNITVPRLLTKTPLRNARVNKNYGNRTRW